MLLYIKCYRRQYTPYIVVFNLQLIFSYIFILHFIYFLFVLYLNETQLIKMLYPHKLLQYFKCVQYVFGCAFLPNELVKRFF